jgi:hypothetical protein
MSARKPLPAGIEAECFLCNRTFKSLGQYYRHRDMDDKPIHCANLIPSRPTITKVST